MSDPPRISLHREGPQREKWIKKFLLMKRSENATIPTYYALRLIPRLIGLFALFRRPQRSTNSVIIRVEEVPEDTAPAASEPQISPVLVGYDAG